MISWDEIIKILPTYGLLGISVLVLAYIAIVLDGRITEKDVIISKLRDERAEKQMQVIMENTQSNHELVRVIEGMQRLMDMLSNGRR